MAQMFADVLKAKSEVRARKGKALDSYVAQAERQERIDREFGERSQQRDPMSPEAIGTLTPEELKIKYPALRGVMHLGANQAGQEWARQVNDGTPTGAPVTFVQGTAPEGSES